MGGWGIREFDSFASRQMKIGDINPMDRRFWPKDPEPGFSPERNKKVIADSIKKYEKMRAKKLKEFDRGLAERADAVASFLTRHGRFSMTPSKGPLFANTLERYFGKRYLAKLRGQEIVDKLKRIGDPRLSNLRRRVWNEGGIYLGKPKKQKC